MGRRENDVEEAATAAAAQREDSNGSQGQRLKCFIVLTCNGAARRSCHAPSASFPFAHALQHCHKSIAKTFKYS